MVGSLRSEALLALNPLWGLVYKLHKEALRVKQAGERLENTHIIESGERIYDASMSIISNTAPIVEYIAELERKESDKPTLLRIASKLESFAGDILYEEMDKSLRLGLAEGLESVADKLKEMAK